MRIWSVHPKYLDAKGLVALWRETLLAKHVLCGKTKGYRNHPQLERFKATLNPTNAVDAYLAEVYHEALNRGYNFNRDKIAWNFKAIKMDVTHGQLKYEAQHLLNKLKVRDNEKYKQLNNVSDWHTHPLFQVVPGEIESWEVL